MTTPRKPCVTWEEIEELNAIFGKGEPFAPSEYDPTGLLFAAKVSQADARVDFHMRMRAIWPKLYRELRDAYRGE